MTFGSLFVIFDDIDLVFIFEARLISVAFV